MITKHSRLLSEEEGLNFTDCHDYVPTHAGNLVNSLTEWNITGTLIKKINMEDSDILCTSRTLLVPVRYRTVQDAMAICEELGETGRYSLYSFCLIWNPT